MLALPKWLYLFFLLCTGNTDKTEITFLMMCPIKAIQSRQLFLAVRTSCMEEYHHSPFSQKRICIDLLPISHSHLKDRQRVSYLNIGRYPLLLIFVFADA